MYEEPRHACFYGDRTIEYTINARLEYSLFKKQVDRIYEYELFQFYL